MTFLAGILGFLGVLGGLLFLAIFIAEAFR
jgi:hypothetical protein